MTFFKKQSKVLLEPEIQIKQNKPKLIWMETLVSDLDRALAFYENVLNIQLEKNDFFGRRSAFFGNSKEGYTGALIQVPIKTHENNIRPFYKVDVMHEALKSVSVYGGSILKAPELLKQQSVDGKILIGANLLDGEIGYICEIADSEGNKIFLYSHS